MQGNLKMSGLTPYDYVDGKNIIQRLAVAFCIVSTVIGWATIFGLALILK